MKKLVFALFSLMVATNMASAQQLLTLGDALATALNNHPTIKAQMVQRQVAANSVDKAFAGKALQASVGANLQTNWNGQQNPASFITEVGTLNGSLTPTVNATYPLYDGGRAAETMNQLSLLYKQSDLSLRATMEGIATEVKNAYFAAQVIEKQQISIREVLALSRDRIMRQEVRQSYGQAGSLDILQAKDAYMADSVLFLNQANSLRLAKERLLLAIGESTLRPDQVVLVEEMAPGLEVFSAEVLEAKILEANTTLMQVDLARELAAANTKIQETRMNPTLALNGAGSLGFSRALYGEGTFLDGSVRNLGGINNTTQSAVVGLAFAYPIADGGLRRKQIEIAKLQEQVADHNREWATLQVRTQARNLAGNYALQQETAALAAQRESIAKQSLDISEQRYNAGQISSFDYRAVQNGYLNAVTARLAAQLAALTTAVELERLSGMLLKS